MVAKPVMMGWFPHRSHPSESGRERVVHSCGVLFEGTKGLRNNEGISILGLEMQ